jgi:hypothetical protein
MILSVLLIGVLAIAFWPETKKPEPVYKGRRLSEWAEATEQRRVSAAEMAEAFEAIGTNGIPTYVQWISYNPGLAERAKINLAIISRRWLRSTWDPTEPYKVRARVGLSALVSFGEKAAPAIPQLVSLATRLPTPASRYSVLASEGWQGFEGLRSIGLPAVPAFLSLMEHSNAEVRAFAIASSQHLLYNTAILARVNMLLQDPDSRVKGTATKVISPY